jgi:hypothetical protein
MIAMWALPRTGRPAQTFAFRTPINDNFVRVLLRDALHYATSEFDLAQRS